MKFWQQENDEPHLQLAIEADERGYERYAEYCRLRDKGLRGNAFEVLSQFISEFQNKPLDWRRGFVDWLLSYCFRNSWAIYACPVPLKKRIIAPTIEEWTSAEPDNPLVLRWNDDERAMLVAARAVPKDEIAVGRFAMTIVARVDYASHELPSGYLGESAQDDLADVQTVIDLLHTVPEARYFHPLREEALSLKMILQKHLATE